LRAVVENRTLGFVNELFSALLDELVDSRHIFDLLVKIWNIFSKLPLRNSKKAILGCPIADFYPENHGKKGIIRPYRQYDKNYFNIIFTLCQLFESCFLQTFSFFLQFRRFPSKKRKNRPRFFPRTDFF
jgi:hypothetical protein